MRKIIAAPEGCSLLTYYGQESPWPEFVKWPIVAWAVDTDGSLAPITSDGRRPSVNGQGWTVLQPDGSVVRNDDTWSNLEEWLESKRCPM